MFLGKISKQDFGPPPAPPPYRIDFAKNRKKSARGVARIFSGGGGQNPRHGAPFFFAEKILNLPSSRTSWGVPNDTVGD